MTIIDGIYKRKNSNNCHKFYELLGVPEKFKNSFCNPKNEILVKVATNPDGTFTFITESSMDTDINNTLNLKLGEAKLITEPFPYTATMTKKNPNKYCLEMQYKGATIIEDITFHNYGITANSVLKEKNISMTEEYERITPKVTGFFVLISENNALGIVNKLMPEIDEPILETIRNDAAFRITLKNEIYTWETHMGMRKLETKFRLDEEYDYLDTEFGFASSNVTTVTSPGVFLTMSKSKKDGTVIETTVVFSEDGATLTQKVAGVTATYFYRRMADTDGSFKKVAAYGLAGYLDALGVKEPLKSNMIEEKDQYSCEMFGKKLRKFKSNSTFFPGEFSLMVGEENAVDFPEFGTMKLVLTESKDSNMVVGTMDGKTIVETNKYSDNFAISEVMVDGIPSSRAVMIYVRE